MPDEEQVVVRAVCILNVETGQTDFLPLCRLGELSHILAGKIHEHEVILYRSKDFDFLKSLGAFKKWHSDSKQLHFVRDMAHYPYDVDLPEIYQFNFERPFPVGLSDLITMKDSELSSAACSFCQAIYELVEDNFVSPFTYRTGSVLINGRTKCAIIFRDHFMLERFGHWEASRNMVNFMEENTVCKECGAPAMAPFVCCDDSVFSFSPNLFDEANSLSKALVARFKAYKQQLRRQGRISKTPSQNRITSRDIELLRQLQEGRCFYCSSDLQITEEHKDHYIPIAEGGAHTLDNIVLACRNCNMIKSDNQVRYLWSQLRESLGKEHVKLLQTRARKIKVAVRNEIKRRGSGKSFPNF